jgi:xylosylprotein 4-beta-galactosyltransferase
MPAESSFVPPDSANYAKRLAIIVPYRDRAEHLARFLPHMVTYFERDKLDRAIAYSIDVVEQLGDARFNRGALLNAGVRIARREADYFCFHDVDYLPIWADYSYVPRPTRLVWHGLDPHTDYASFFGAVVAFNRGDFERINGYSNDYWGWGYEDDDLRTRCGNANLSLAFRDGTYSTLAHPHQGFNDDATPTPSATATAKTFTAKLLAGASVFSREGLSTLDFRVEETAVWTRNGQPQPHIRHHKIALDFDSL